MRIEAGRLRAKLKQYYENYGQDDSVEIQFRPGSYVPTFVERVGPPPATRIFNLLYQFIISCKIPALIALAFLAGMAVRGYSVRVAGFSAAPPHTAGNAVSPVRADAELPFDMELPSDLPVESGELIGRGLDRYWQVIDGATARDEEWRALVYVGLANSYDVLATIESLPPREAIPRARAAAVKALQLDPDLAAAHAALGFIHSVYDWDWSGAELEFKRALELKPSSAAHVWYALACLESRGENGKALTDIEQALRLSPAQVDLNAAYAGILVRSGRYDQAITQCRKTLALAPYAAGVYRDLGLALQRKLRYPEAISAAREASALSHGDPAMLAELGYVYAISGDRDDAEHVLFSLNQMSQRQYVSPYHLATVYMGLAERDQTFKLLHMALEEHSIWLNGIKVDPIFAGLHGDSRFNEVLGVMGLYIDGGIPTAHRGF